MATFYFTNDSYELQHHGILGMKWGVKNGPPYPLDTSSHSKREKKAGWRKSLSNGNAESKDNKKASLKRQDKYDKKAQKYYDKAERYQTKIDSISAKNHSSRKVNKLEKKKKKALRDAEIKKKGKLTNKEKAMVVGATVVAAYATYKFIDSGHAEQLIAKGKNALGMTDSVFKKNPELANKNLSNSEIFDKVVSRINPDYGAIGTKNNCRRCTFAYEMSRRGYDVKATKTLRGSGQNTLGLLNALNEGGIFRYFANVGEEGTYANRLVMGTTNHLGLKDIWLPLSPKDNAKRIFDTLSSEYPNGARGEIEIKWNCGGGHSMAFEIVKGKPVIFDCQTKEMYSSFEDFSEIGEYIKSASSTRLDNVDLNEDFLMRWLQNAS